MKKLSRKTLNTCWIKWFFGHLHSMSFQWLQAFGFATSMAPVLRELYPDNKTEQISGLKRHAAFYNTEPQLGCVVMGVVCGLEEEKANGADIDDEMINSIKLGLMGPLAGIGDAMIPGMYIPLLLSIGIGMSGNGSVLGPLFYIFTYILSMLLATHFIFMKGYLLGTKSIDLIIGETTRKIRNAFNLLGAIVVGGVGASYVHVATRAVIKTSETSSIVINDMINGIFPNLLSLATILFCWWLMSKKKISSVKIMLILFIISLAGVAVGFF